MSRQNLDTLRIDDLIESFQQAEEMRVTLDEDCNWFLLQVKRDGSQRYRRSYIRSLFALIESQLYGSRQNAIRMNQYFGRLDRYEIIALEEKSLQVQEDGEVKATDQFRGFLNVFRLTFRADAKSVDSEFKLDIGGRGWQSLKRAVKVRDRLVHPKSPQSLEVKDEEIEAATLAYKWFLAVSALALAHYTKALNHKVPAPDHMGVSEVIKSIPSLEVRVKEIESKVS